MFAEGMLAIWSDVAPEAETDYLHWLTREHTQERVTTEGFLRVRVFRAMDFDLRRYLIVYDLNSATALSGPDYVHKLDNPTPWSQRIMPTLRNFVRGGGTVIAAAGTGQGGFAAALLLDDASAADAEIMMQKLVKQDRVCSARLLKVDNAKTSIATREKSLRQSDRSFENLLLVDGLDPAAVRSALEAVRSLTRDPSTPFVYKQVYQLDRALALGAA